MISRKIFVLLFFLIWPLLADFPAWAALASRHRADHQTMAPVFLPLQNWLIEQGVPAATTIKYLEQAQFEGKLLASMLSRKEISRDYQVFFAPNKLEQARVFKARYLAFLEQTVLATGVPGEVIVAILLIESDLGGNTGKTGIFNALASQAVLDSALAREKLAIFWPIQQKDYLASEAALTRFAKRAAWAREELLTLIHLSGQWRVSPLSIKGSPAGALGWCQFMPTSIERWGADGSGDGQVDVYNPLDAIVSVGHYLQEHGWRVDASREEQLQVVLTYNKSTPYAQAVLELADKL